MQRRHTINVCVHHGLYVLRHHVIYVEQLAPSLSALGVLHQGGNRIFRSSEVSRTHCERLNRAGFIAPVINGLRDR